jgi:hypothetical protein
MKKIIIAASLLMVGCAKEDVKQEPIKDCNCDRIVRVLPSYAISSTTNTTYSGGAITINDCSGEQRKFGNGNGTYKFSQKVGECYNW